jgi:hypothetical protein
MSVVTELLRTEEDGTLSFGNYELAKKTKLEDYEFQGDLYKVKTFNEITKLEKNGMFLYESVPGTSVTNMQLDEKGLSFTVEGPEDAQITVGLEDSTEYEVEIDGVDAGSDKTNMGGKLSLSVELEPQKQIHVVIKKK